MLFSTSVELESDNVYMYVCKYVCPEPENLKNDGILLNFAHLFFGWIPGDIFLNFFYGPGDNFLYQNKTKPLRQPGEPKIVGFGWNLVHMFWELSFSFEKLI